MAIIKVITILLVVSVPAASFDGPSLKITSTDPHVNSPDGKIIVQNIGEDVQLTCTVRNKPEFANVAWLLKFANFSVTQIINGTSSINGFKWVVYKPSPIEWRLRIQNVQVANEGMYICRIQYKAQLYRMDSRELKVVQVPKISNIVTGGFLGQAAGNPSRLTCYASGRPAPLIRWTRKDRKLFRNGTPEYFGNVYNIDVLQSTDAGIYTCKATNLAGSDEKEIRLSVYFRPGVSFNESSVKQAVGHATQLICNIKANPLPTEDAIAWEKDGKAVLASSRGEIHYIPGSSDSVTSTLDINEVTQWDYGSYRCSAYNMYGSVYDQMKLISSPNSTNVR